MKKIHTLYILDRSGSMRPFKDLTIERLNSNLATLRDEATKTSDVQIFNTLLSFSGYGGMQFHRVAKNVIGIEDLTQKEYFPDGGTPLLDAIGDGIERLKTEIGDEMGMDDLSILVTIYTDGEENESRRYSHAQIKKMIEHFSSDKKWTFVFVGCGSLDDVKSTSANLGIAANNTIAFDNTNASRTVAFEKTSTYYSNYVASVTKGTDMDGAFDGKQKP